MENKRPTVREKYSSYKDIKIAVYNIMRNEEKFLEGWLENMKGADYILLLDTGSENGEYEIAKGYADVHPEFKGKLFVEQEIIKPWRFDVARNRNMEMIPDDDKVDVIISVDLDERLTDGFFDELRKTAWEHPRCHDFDYYYAWSHDESTGRPLRTISYNKCSFWMKGEIYYSYPVHETLTYTDKYKAFYNEKAAWIDPEIIWLHHWPDNTKSRSSYLPLLELRAEENPNDDYGKFYLLREQMCYGQWEKALKTGIWLYSRTNRENDDMMMLPSTCSEIANCFSRIKGKEEEVEFFYKRAIEYDPTFRDPYFFYAKWLCYHGRPLEALSILGEGINKSRRHYDWRELSITWEPWYEAQVRADAYCWLGDYNLAYETMKKAEEGLASDGDKKEAAQNGFYNDYDWVKKKLKSLEAPDE